MIFTNPNSMNTRILKAYDVHKPEFDEEANVENTYKLVSLPFYPYLLTHKDGM